MEYMDVIRKRRSIRKFKDAPVPAEALENGTVMVPAEHICLTAASHGLGSCWIGDIDVKKASEILGLPEKYACVFLILIGYPDMEPADIPRRRLEEITFNNRYGG